MTALNFPNNPTVGQIYTVGSKSWIWTGQAWAIQRTGVTGASAYDLAVQNGFVGTEAQWIASLKGATGPSGVQGPAGTPGAAGPKGDPGTPGTNGTNGTAGTNGVGVPAGGGVGQVLQKNSNGDFDTNWVTPQYLTDYTVPLGGSQGQFLGKSSGSDGDFHWMNVPATAVTPNELPTGGNTGQVLTKNSTSQGDVSWQNVPNAAGVPDGGSAGQVLTKNTATNGDVSWQPAAGGIQDAPADGNLYARSNGAWEVFVPGSGTGSGDGTSTGEKIWGVVNGNTSTIIDGEGFTLNNASTAGSATTRINVVFNNPRANANYAVVLGGQDDGANYGTIPFLYHGTPTTTGFTIVTHTNSPASETPLARVSFMVIDHATGGNGGGSGTATNVVHSDTGPVGNISGVETYPTKLAALNDVRIAGVPNNGQSLIWNSADAKWEAGDVTGSDSSSVGGGVQTSSIIPQLVQAASSRGNGSFTCTLTNAPTVGNTLVIIASGFNTAKTYPTGFTQLAYYVPSANQQVSMAIKKVVAGDPTSYTVTYGDNGQGIILELDQIDYIYSNAGPLSVDANSNWLNFFPGAPFGQSLSVLAVEHDNSSDIHQDGNAPVVYEFVADGTLDNGNHRGYFGVYQQGGTSLTLAGTIASPSSPGWGQFYFGKYASALPSLIGNAGKFLSVNGSASGLTWIAGQGGTPVAQVLPVYRIGSFFGVTPSSNEIVLLHPVVDAFTIPAYFTGSQVYAGVNPTASCTFTVTKIVSGTESAVGTITINPDGSFATTTVGNAAVSMPVGSVLKVVAPELPDQTIANVAYTLKGDVA